MLPNISQELYNRFAKEGYRLKNYRDCPVPTIAELVQLAYLDVNRTLRHVQPDQSHTIKLATISFVKHLLVQPPTSQAQFDQLHADCCQTCLDASSPNGAKIHYGQAQKLINMTLKYLFNEYARFNGSSNQFGFPANNVEQWFHLPIDSQIRNALVGLYDFEDPTPKPWSQWSQEDYLSFQSQIRQRLKPGYWPLEIDYLLWNATSDPAGGAILPKCLVIGHLDR